MIFTVTTITGAAVNVEADDWQEDDGWVNFTTGSFEEKTIEQVYVFRAAHIISIRPHPER
jgi:hypothetical protein